MVQHEVKRGRKPTLKFRVGNQTLSLKEISEKYNIGYMTLYLRYKKLVANEKKVTGKTLISERKQGRPKKATVKK